MGSHTTCAIHCNKLVHTFSIYTISHSYTDEGCRRYMLIQMIRHATPQPTSRAHTISARYIMTSPPDHAMPGQSKRRRIDGSDATGGEGLTELEVLGISGECMVTLNVSDSMHGRDLWNLILGEVRTKPGLQLVVSHTSRLALNESLQQQGLGGQRAQVSATHIPVNLLAALRFAFGDNVEDEEFSLNGITKVTGVSDKQPALLHNLPKSIRTLTFDSSFNQEIHDVRLPAGLQSLTFGTNFDQRLDNVTWPAGHQSLTLGHLFNQKLDNVTLPAGLQSLTLGHLFNQKLDNVTWPAGLQILTFGMSFDQRLDMAGQCDMASRPSKLNFWYELRSEPGRCDMASQHSKFDSWWVPSKHRQRNVASRPSKFDFW